MINIGKTKTTATKRLSGAVLAGAMLATGCVSPVAGPGGNYADPIGNAPVTANPMITRAAPNRSIEWLGIFRTPP